MQDFIVEKRNCPYCNETELAVLLHNATSKPKDWISIVEARSGDSRLNMIENFFGATRGNIADKGWLPTAICQAGRIVIQAVRDRTHYYSYLKSLKR